MRAAGSPRTKPREDRRDDLLRSAQRLFLETGVDQVAVEDITREAGMSKGSFYLHFQTKGDVIVALRARFVDDLLRGIEARVGERPAEDWRGRLTAWVRTLGLRYREAARLHALVFETAPLPARHGMTRNPLIDSLAQLLKAGTRAGAWRIEDADFTAVFLFNALHGVVTQDATDETAANPSEDQLERRLLRLQAHVDRVVFGHDAGPGPSHDGADETPQG